MRYVERGGHSQGHSAKGQFPDAVKALKHALTKAPENQQAYLPGLPDQLETGTDIN